jgi:hypothetical protein
VHQGSRLNADDRGIAIAIPVDRGMVREPNQGCCGTPCAQKSETSHDVPQEQAPVRADLQDKLPADGSVVQFPAPKQA